MVCPRNSDPQQGKYCPAWTEYTETNIQTGEDRTRKECLFQAMPRFMIEAIKASNRPAAAAESMRNEVAKGFSELNGRMQRIPALLLESKPGAGDRGGD